MSEIAPSSGDASCRQILRSFGGGSVKIGHGSVTAAEGIGLGWRNPAGRIRDLGGGMVRILLVEDEAAMAAALRSVLEREGYVVDHVSGVVLAREAARFGNSDLVLLDRTLSDGDGLSIVPYLREHNPGIPIIVITALGDVTDRVTGLDTGADDYLAKPFAMEEVLARIRAVRRRPASLHLQQIKLGQLAYDLENDEASVSGERLDLPRRELLVLGTLMRRRGRTVVRRSLEEAVYGFDDEIQSNTLDSHVSRLRRRLADAAADVEIHAIRGVGYLIRQIP